MEKYIVAGGSGFIGKHLCSLLTRNGHEVFVLTTQKSKINASSKWLQYVYWNPAEKYIDPAFTLSACTLINLAGAGVADQRWTSARKKEILESRIQSLDTLYDAIEKKQINPSHLLSTSAIGYYGEGDKIFNEDDPGDDSFLSSTCRQWEKGAWHFAHLDLPIAIARIGIVLGKEGGALKEFLKPLRFGVAGIPANGKQVYSWIHVDDVSRMFYYLSSNKKEGIFNAVSPNPVTLNQLFDELIKHIKPFFLKVHAPEFALRIMLGEMAVEILKSTCVSSKKIQEDGFTFLYEDIASCLNSLMGE